MAGRIPAVALIERLGTPISDQGFHLGVQGVQAHARADAIREEGEALRDDENFSFTSAWEFEGVGAEPTLHKEDLTFEHVPLTQRSYK